MSENDRIVFGGVDTHRDTHVAAVVDATGRVLDTATFNADATGYEQLNNWLGSWGRVAQVGIEGTGSYGAGLSRHLTGIGVEVAEVNRPNRACIHVCVRWVFYCCGWCESRSERRECCDAY